MAEQLITPGAVRQVLRDYWQQYRIHPWYTAIACFVPALGSILVIFVPPLIVANLINLFVARGEISLTATAGPITLLAVLWMTGEVFWRIGMHYLIKLEAGGMEALGKLAFRRLADRDYDFYTNNFVGSLTKKALAFSKNFETFTDTFSFNIINNALPVVFVVVVLWFYSPWIPLVLLFCLAVVIGVALPIIRRRSKFVALQHEASSKMSGRLSDAVTNIAAVKAFAKEDREYDLYKNYVEDFTRKFKYAADYQNIRFETVISPLYVSTNVIGLIAAIFFAQMLHLQAGTIVVVFSYYASVTRIFWEISRIYRHLESSVGEAAEFNQLFVEPPAILDVPAARPLHVTEAAVRFDGAYFKYGRSGKGEKPNEVEDAGDAGGVDEDSFLNDFNLVINGNQKVGLVGPSGGGKTTITKLLLRFTDLQSGSIAIDGQDISRVTQASLREAIAYVPQEPVLFHRTLFENIAYGNEKATKQEVFRAAKIAHADDFINELPLGYQTLVGERGIKLSGGQRQRVAIARALLKNAPLLVLDEATSSLDSESEKYIQEGLWELMKNKTALVIAHRLSTIKHLDRIIVLDRGKIVEDGTHSELTKRKGLYAKLWSHQSGEFL